MIIFHLILPYNIELEGSKWVVLLYISGRWILSTGYGFGNVFSLRLNGLWSYGLEFVPKSGSDFFRDALTL